MNRIYQGRVSKVEIPNILSASTGVHLRLQLRAEAVGAGLHLTLQGRLRR